jgi:hypothetical protein
MQDPGMLLIELPGGPGAPNPGSTGGWNPTGDLGHVPVVLYLPDGAPCPSGTVPAEPY